MRFGKSFSENSAAMEGRLLPDENFDIISRRLVIGGRKAALYFTDGFIKDEMFEKILEFLFKITPQQLDGIENMARYSELLLPYVETTEECDVDEAVAAVLSGPSVLIIDGIANALVMDTREYPVRSVSEPDKDRSLRGSRDGFVETLIFNTALLRRRIRDPRLRVRHIQVGRMSRVDVAVCYIDGVADKKAVDNIYKRLKAVDIDGVSMTAQAIAEKLAPTVFFNPFPKIRYTERPDFASACVLEGKIAVVMDNSPVVMLLPTSFADFSREADDYYFPRLTGTYIRLLRIFISLFTVILTPLALMLLNSPELLPPWLLFIVPRENAALSFFVQFLALEFIIDGLRLASLNTPDTLSSSLGVIGGLLLSEFAVSAGWFQGGTILYMAFVAIASYSQPSYEMGYALKFVRILTLVLVQLFSVIGFFVGIGIGFLGMLLCKSVVGRGYMYPVIPFSARDFIKLFVRTKIGK